MTSRNNDFTKQTQLKWKEAFYYRNTMVYTNSFNDR